MLTWRDAAFDKIRLEATLVAGEVSGEGILKTKDHTYTGTLKNGIPHGSGYFEYTQAGGWYEGEVAAGKRHGKGIYIALNRSRYAGVWSDGKRNGWGEATFATGGSYAGGWKNDKFDGHGNIVYAGTGHKYEGRFKDGRVDGLPEAELAPGRYAIKETRVGSRIAEDTVVSYLPLAASWNKLTEAQKNMLRLQFPALEAGDEPPFPQKGGHTIFDAVQQVYSSLGGTEGTMEVHVLVGKDGTPKQVKAIGSPTPELVHNVSAILMLQKYKPAICRGEPCEMIYPIRFSFSVSD